MDKLRCKRCRKPVSLASICCEDQEDNFKCQHCGHVREIVFENSYLGGPLDGQEHPGHEVEIGLTILHPSGMSMRWIDDTDAAALPLEFHQYDLDVDSVALRALPDDGIAGSYEWIYAGVVEDDELEPIQLRYRDCRRRERASMSA